MADKHHIGGRDRYASVRPGGTAEPRRGAGRGGRAARWVRIAIRTGIVLAILVAAAGVVLYRAAKHVPDFYRQALQADPVLQQIASDKMVRQVAGLASDVNKSGRWQAIFTEEEINGWLAVDLVKSYSDLLPGAVSDPRVSIEPDRVTAACRYRSPPTPVPETVLSLAVEVYLAEPNVIALRVRKVRAGAVPLPLGSVLDEIAQATRRLQWEVRWRRAEGDPVALITIPPPKDKRGRVVQIQKIELAKGEIRVAGTSRRP